MMPGALGEEPVRLIYPELLKRLDDSNDVVRMAVCGTIAAFFRVRKCYVTPISLLRAPATDGNGGCYHVLCARNGILGLGNTCQSSIVHVAQGCAAVHTPS